MSVDSVVTMVIVIGGVWGGFAYLLVRAARAEGKLPAEQEVDH